MTNHPQVLYLLTDQAKDVARPSMDTVWFALEDEASLLAPTKHSPVDPAHDWVINVVGSLPAEIEGWVLLLG